MGSIEWSYVLVLSGLMLLAASHFFIRLWLTLLAISALLGGLTLLFQTAALSSSTKATVVVFALAIVVLMPDLVFAPLRGWFYRPLEPNSAEADATVATMPVNVELEQLRGRFGKALTALRPAGAVNFDGKRIDCLSEGTLIEPGIWVRCIDVKAGRVIVRPMDPPQLDDLELPDFH